MRQGSGYNPRQRAPKVGRNMQTYKGGQTFFANRQKMNRKDRDIYQVREK